MTRKKKREDDPVVQEVREIRQKLWKQAGETYEGLQTLLDKTVPKRRRTKNEKRKSARLRK
jgi:hypothetical protein